MTHDEFVKSLNEGDEVRVAARRSSVIRGEGSNDHIIAGFEGTLLRLIKGKNQLVAEVREAKTQATRTVLARHLRPISAKTVLIATEDGELKRKKSGKTVRVSNGTARAPKPCTCGCGGTTGGGNFLPGHDARLISMVIKGERKPDVLAPFPALKAKYEAKSRAR